MSTLAIVAKPPVAGKVKTRLVPPLSPEQAAELSAAFLDDLIVRLSSLPGVAVHLRIPGSHWPRNAQAVPARSTIPVKDQGSGDLGQRLAHAFQDSFETEPRPVAVMGADHPTLPRRAVLACLQDAAAGNAAWITTDDGGYALLALPEFIPNLLRDIPWSTPEVARETRRRAKESSIGLIDHGPWYDVDTPADLDRLRRELRQGDGCPRTRALLKTLAF